MNYDNRNYRKHSKRNKNLINKSLKENGAGRSITLDAEGNVVCGNGVYEQAKKLKIPIRTIETDGKELIAVKRIDLKPDDLKRKQLAIMDNSTSDTSEFDFELLTEDFSFSELANIGVDMDFDEKTAEIFNDAESGAFIDELKNSADIITVTFGFPKEKENIIKNYIKKVGKAFITKNILASAESSGGGGG